MDRSCHTCCHISAGHCTHPDVRLIGIRVLLPDAGACDDWEEMIEIEPSLDVIIDRACGMR